MTIREQREALEASVLSSAAVLASESWGRIRDEVPDNMRTCFQRDVDRITYSKAFRRLKHKTQVFLQPDGDHYRTRLTHTLEVTRIARTIARALTLNEDLTEAIALGHDLGHTPFGHAGERALREIYPGGFEHNEQSLRVVDRIEKNGLGLNLTYEVRRGILCHTGDDIPESLEGRIIRLADRVAYINHDVDDAIRAGIMDAGDIPDEIVNALGVTYSQRINTAVTDIVETSAQAGDIGFSPNIYFIMESFRDFMFENVYKNPIAKGEERKVKNIIGGLYDYYVKNPDRLPDDYRAWLDRDGIERVVCDYISGMTDQYAVYCFNDIFIPYSWHMR